MNPIKKMRKILKDLKIDFISIVEGEMDPVNQDATTLFVKSRKKEEEQEMKDGKVNAFLKSIGLMKIDEPSPEESPIEEPKFEKAEEEVKKDTPEFVTKADFETAIGEIKTLITDVTKTQLAKAEESKIDTVTKLVKAFQEDIGSLKEDFASHKRGASPVETQMDLLDIIKSSGDAKLKKGVTAHAASDGQVVNEFIGELIEKGKFEGRIRPQGETEFDQVISRLCSTGFEEGGAL